MSLQLKIISVERTLFSGQVSEVTLPGEAGPFTILPSHAPIISSLAEGCITFIPDGKTKDAPQGNQIKISGGFAEMNEDVVTVCVTE